MELFWNLRAKPNLSDQSCVSEQMKMHAKVYQNGTIALSMLFCMSELFATLYSFEITDGQEKPKLPNFLSDGKL